MKKVTHPTAVGNFLIVEKLASVTDVLEGGLHMPSDAGLRVKILSISSELFLPGEKEPTVKVGDTCFLAKNAMMHEVIQGGKKYHICAYASVIGIAL